MDSAQQKYLDYVRSLQPGDRTYREGQLLQIIDDLLIDLDTKNQKIKNLQNHLDDHIDMKTSTNWR